MIISYCCKGMRHSSHYSFIIHRFITKKTYKQQVAKMENSCYEHTCAAHVLRVDR